MGIICSSESEDNGGVKMWISYLREVFLFYVTLVYISYTIHGLNKHQINLKNEIISFNQQQQQQQQQKNYKECINMC